jgi:hypothetical protein
VRAWARVIARRDGGGEDWEECKLFRQASRWPKEVASARGGIMQDNSGSKARYRGEPARPANTNSTEKSRYDRGAKRAVGVVDKLGSRKVADTGYSREERERDDMRGGTERAGSHTLPGTCVEKI